MKEQKQLSLFGDKPIETAWQKEWKGMPEFTHEDVAPFQKIVVNFKTKEDVKAFAQLIGQKLSFKTDTIWFPRKEYLKTGIFKDEP